jgi:hypothetical protein
MRNMKIVLIATVMESAIVVILLAILFIAGQLFINRYKRNKGARVKRMPRRVEARAVVLAIEQTGLFMNRQPQVKMQMQVIPDKGRNFVAEVKQVLNSFDLEVIKTGSIVTVLYNPTNTKEVKLVKAV